MMAEEEDVVCYPLSVDYCGVCSMPPEVLDNILRYIY